MTQTEPDFIDVKQLIRDYDLPEHIRRADAYFAGMDDDDWRHRKPFANTVDTGWHLILLGNMFAAAQLFPGARVLDFGCANGWLTRMLASMGCHATGTDVSRIAMAAGERYARRHQPELLPRLDWKLFDGERIDLPDASLDRILCHDVFHHVPNQLQVLREFRRVLRPDGIAVFSEPGPEHSKTAASQDEMRKFGVIENDMIAEEVEAFALEAGFAPVQLSLFSTAPVQLPVGEYLAMGEAERPGAPGGGANPAFRAALWPSLYNLRAFVMRPTVAADQNSSRDEAQCQGKVTLLDSRPEGKGRRLRLLVANTGGGWWLPSGSSQGAVNLGLMLAKDGVVVDRNLRRHHFLTAPLPPGGTSETEFLVPEPAPPGHDYQLALVAEYVCWFPGAPLTL
jgi:2-polyprenyl-3-methyl-5-hydroxy-6-metoxy-1,4-benzoquinol methylase